MTKITQADRDAAETWRRDFGRKGSHLDLLNALAAHREEAFEAGREQAEREVVDWLRHHFGDSPEYDAIENKEHRDDTD